MIIKKDQSVIKSYLEDSSGLLGGNADFVFIPESESEISEFLRDASKRGVPVTVSGAGTGVTGGRIPFGGSVLSLEKLNNIIEFKEIDSEHSSVVVQSGMRVGELKKVVLEKGWMYPPDPTELNAFIGGNVATNASGSRGFKYGATRKYITGMRVVLSNGDIISIRRGEIFADNKREISIPKFGNVFKLDLNGYRSPGIKNSAGYYNMPGMDLIDLFIGQEGTLGVITEVEVKLTPSIEKTLGGIVFFRDKRHAWNFVEEIKNLSRINRVNENLSGLDALALEYFDKNAIKLIKSDFPAIPDFAEAAIIFEEDISCRDEGKVIEEWSRYVEKHNAPIENVWLATNQKDQESLKNLRHSIPEKVNEIVRKHGFPKTGTDLAVPDSSFRTMLDIYDETFEKSGIMHLIFGHIGENHLHANLLPSNKDEFDECNKLYGKLAENAVLLGGTVSAEHGIGKIKHHFLEKMVGKNGIMMMARIKKELDPKNILGVDNIFKKTLTNDV